MISKSVFLFPFLLIQPRSLQQLLPYLVGQPLRLQDFDVRASWEQRRVEVIRYPQPVFKVGPVLAWCEFTMAVLECQDRLCAWGCRSFPHSPNSRLAFSSAAGYWLLRWPAFQLTGSGHKDSQRVIDGEIWVSLRAILISISHEWIFK